MQGVIEKAHEVVGQCLRVAMEDGHAEVMGDGMFVLFQAFEGKTHSVTVSSEDLLAILSRA